MATVAAEALEGRCLNLEPVAGETPTCHQLLSRIPLVSRCLWRSSPRLLCDGCAPRMFPGFRGTTMSGPLSPGVAFAF